MKFNINGFHTGTPHELLTQLIIQRRKQHAILETINLYNIL